MDGARAEAGTDACLEAADHRPVHAQDGHRADGCGDEEARQDAGRHAAK